MSDCVLMLVTGVSQLYGRLFDHHAVLQAEINHMKEYDKLTETCENSSKVSFALLYSSHKILLTKSKIYNSSRSKFLMVSCPDL